MADQVTTTNDVIDPQVIADIVSPQLTAAMKFAPLCDMDNTLQGTPGSTIQFPAWNYIGDAEDIVEGQAIPTRKLTQGQKAATIKEVGIGVPVTDETIQIGIGDPINEAGQQILTSLGNKKDNDVLGTMKGSAQTATVDATVDGMQSALDTFNFEDDNAQLVLICSPKAAGALRLSAAKSFIGAAQLQNTIISGAYGDILGVQIVRSRKLDANEAYLVNAYKGDGRPVLKMINKRNVFVETERIPKERTTVIYGSAMYAPYLFDPTKLVKVTFNGVTGPNGTTGVPADVADNGDTVDNVPEEKRVGRQKKTTSKKTIGDTGK